jgi:integrase
MATINFYYRSKKDNAYLTTKLRFSHDKKDFVKTAKTEIHTSSEVWQKKGLERIKDAEIKKEVNRVNKECLDLEAFILQKFEAEPNKLKTSSAEWLNNVINEFYNPTKDVPTDLIEYFNYYLKARKNEITTPHKQKIENLRNHLELIEHEHQSKYKIEQVNESFKNSFVDFYKKNKYSENYIKKQFVILKQVCNHAEYNGIKTSHQLKKLSIKGMKTPKIYLSPQELTKIENTTFDKPHLETAKQWLIISCYTGQRISDFMRFTKDMIRVEDGKKIIEFKQVKTGKNMTIPVHPKVVEILNQNGGEFPQRQSDQKYNNHIKKVCAKAEINTPTKGRKLVNVGTKENKLFRQQTGVYPKHDLISSHVGRRSFATNFYGEIPTSFLIYVTGHSSETMFLNYIGKSEKDLALKISDYFNN